MAKHQLWIINSGLICLAIIAIPLAHFIKQDLPTITPRKRALPTTEGKRQRIIVKPEKIYENDLFDTYTPPADPQPVSKNLVTPIPALNVKISTAPTKNTKVEFIPPLDITIKGIIMSPHAKQSIVMVTDQTGKEQTYRIGDKINDGQLIKITKNHVIIIRANGQQETFSLRKIEKLAQNLSSWDLAVKKVDDTLYHIDPVEITKEITSIGELIESLDLYGAYKDGISIGVRVGSTKHHPLAGAIGLASGDVITSVNKLPATNSKERMAIYDAIAALPMGGYIHVNIQRDGKDQELSYMLKRIEKPSPFGGKAEDKDNNTEIPKDLFTLSRDAQREQTRRQFEQEHRTKEQHDLAITEMRKKLLSDMKNRAPNRRVP